MNVHIFWPVWAYWWLIFPAMWAVGGTVRMLMRNSYERERLKIIKSYVDQGKDIPDALMRELYR